MNTQPKPEIFISYSRKDSQEVDQLIRWLDQKGIASTSIFFDKDNIHGAGNFPKLISDSIENCSILLFIVSKASVNSEWVKDEVYYALKSKKPVLPIIIEQVKIPGELDIKLSRFQWINLYEGDKESNYQNVLYSLNQLGIASDESNADIKYQDGSSENWFGKNRNKLFWIAAIVLILVFLGYLFQDLLFSPKTNSAAIPEIIINDHDTLKNKVDINEQHTTKSLNEEENLNISNELLTVYYSFRVRKGKSSYEIFNNSEVQKGDSIRILIKSKVDSYIYIINVDATNKADLIYPQGDKSNVLKANKMMSIPGKRDWFLVDGNTGFESLYFIASKEPMADEVQELINNYVVDNNINQKDFNFKQEIQSRSLSQIVEDSDANASQKFIEIGDFDVERYFTGKGVLVKEIRFNHI